MQNMLQGKWAPRLASFVLALLAAGSAAYWVLHWPAGSDAHRRVAVADVGDAPIVPDAEKLARLLGAGGDGQGASASNASSRWRLVGVVAGAGGRGAALIAEDDKPAKPYTVGAAVGDGLVLKSVAPRRAVLAADMAAPPAITLEIPLPAR